MAAIEHVFVLMLENRSFDHLLGFSRIPGLDVVPPGKSIPAGLPIGGQKTINQNGPDAAAADPPHEYDDVRCQLTGPIGLFGSRPWPPLTMEGFFQAAERDKHAGNIAISCMDPRYVPVSVALARQYAVFDNWYSSMPGPTWPNRFFAHAATSGGLDNSPSSTRSALAVLAGLGISVFDYLRFDFEHDTIYERLKHCGLKWRVYHGDAFPQVLAIKDMTAPFFKKNTDFWKIKVGDKNDDFARHLQDTRSPYDIDYTFIEPNYDSTHKFKDGDSMHPLGRVSQGEALIKYVYETIRNSPVWPTSALIITYDEHGGFYDHVAPPRCAHPGDDDRNHEKAEYPRDCDFTLLGVRVPTIIVSPLIPAGVISSQTPALNPRDKRFDHTSIIRSLWDIFPGVAKTAPLTDRDAAAASFAPVFSLGERDARVTEAAAPTVLPDPVPSPLPPAAGLDLVADEEDSTPDGSLNGFTWIAATVDIELRRQAYPQLGLSDLEGPIRARLEGIVTAEDARKYVLEVADRFEINRQEPDPSPAASP